MTFPTKTPSVITKVFQLCKVSKVLKLENKSEIESYLEKLLF